MDLLPLIAACALFAPMEAVEGVGLIPETGATVVDATVGEGLPLRIGDVASVRYAAKDGLGREIANSDKRGLAFTFEIGNPPADAILVQATYGMRLGGERVVWIPAEAVGQGFGGLIPAKTDVRLSLWLDEAKRTSAPPPAPTVPSAEPVPAVAAEQEPVRSQVTESRRSRPRVQRPSGGRPVTQKRVRGYTRRRR
jgi:hypothetical protein